MNSSTPSKYIFALCLIILLGIFLPTCGRKQKNIFSFSQEDVPVINKLSLPVVRGITIQKTKDGALITWLAPNLSHMQQETNKSLSDLFIGFNIYRLVRNNIIQKHPINKKPVTKTEYLDKKVFNKKQNLYLVKIVFSINQQTIEGPASAIASLQEK